MFEQWLEEGWDAAFRDVLYMSWKWYDQELYDQADDAAQEGVLAAVTRGEPHFNDRVHLIRFVKKSARNSARNVWKSAYERKRANLDGTDDGKDGSLPPDELMLQEERQAFLQQGLEALQPGLEAIGEPCRKVLTLYYYNALNDRQIARKLVGNQANDNDRHMICTQRKNCLTEMRRILFQNDVDPDRWL